MPEKTARIVVGVDGSEGSRQALRWAVSEARAHCASLDVVYASPEPVSAPHGPSIPGLVRTYQSMAGRPKRVLDESLANIPTGDVAVRRHIVRAPAAAALVAAASGADLLVVGSRGRNALTGLLLGSVSQECAAHAGCPVVVVPGDRSRGDTTASREEGGGEADECLTAPTRPAREERNACTPSSSTLSMLIGNNSMGVGTR